MHRVFHSVVFTGILLAGHVHPDEQSAIGFSGAQIFYEFGSIVKGVDLATDTLDNYWTQRFGGTFDLKASRGEHLDLFLGTGGIFWHAIPRIEGQTGTKVFFGDAILTKAFAQFDMGGEAENPLLRAKLGFFPVKNTHSRNLGEYMFRTGTYPDFLITGNGYTSVNTALGTTVLGNQWSHQAGDHFSHDVFFTTERQSYPLHDFSLTYLAKLKTGFFNLALGVQFNRLIPVNPSLTTPGEEKNTYFVHNGITYANNPEYYQLLSTGAAKDSNAAKAADYKATELMIDSLRRAWEADPATAPELKKYTFKGIKPMGFLSMDFKALFGGDIFRGDEMVLYAEGVLMGYENQPIFYENRMERLALMAGFNIPTFGLLDNLNVELERLTSKHINGYRNAMEGGIPLPDYNYDAIGGYDPEDWKGDDLKWSVFLSRKVLDGFHVQAQIANDHFRGRRYTRTVSENSLMVDSDNWYYMVKMQAAL